MRATTLGWPILIPALLFGCARPQIEVRALPAPASDIAGDLLTKGKILFARGEYALAIEPFQRAAREDPANADAYNGLAASYDLLGRFDLSRRYYELALARAPEDVRILRNLARSLDRQGDRLAVRKLLEEVAFLTGEGAARTGAVEVALGEDAPAPARPAQNSVTIALDEPAAPLTAQIAPSPDRAKGLVEHVLAFLSPSPKMRSAPSVEIALDPASAAISARKDVPIIVVNADGRRHLAARTRDFLADAGWTSVHTRDSRARLSRSVILYPNDHLENAHQIASTLPFTPRMRVAHRSSRLLLMLGHDAIFLKVAAKQANIG